MAGFQTFGSGRIWPFANILGASVALVVGLLVVSSRPRPKPFETAFYSRLEITPLNDHPPLSFHLLGDKRDTNDAREVGQFVGRSGTFRHTATEPIAMGVSRAFLEGLRMRGFDTTDMTQVAFESSAAARPRTERVLIGDVLEFGYQIPIAGTVTATCVVRLEVYDPVARAKVWEKSYSTRIESSGWRSHFSMLSEALAETVQKAVHDPQLIAAVRTKSDRDAPPPR